MTSLKRTFAGAAAALSLGVAIATATAAVPQQTPVQDPPAITVTGCLIQGSSPSVFLLDNARVNPRDREEVGRRYILVNQVEDTDFKNHLDQEVTVTGTLKITLLPVPVVGRALTEAELSVFTARSVATVSDRCTPAGR
jgi:hypothetical protein